MPAPVDTGVGHWAVRRVADALDKWVFVVLRGPEVPWVAVVVACRQTAKRASAFGVPAAILALSPLAVSGPGPEDGSSLKPGRARYKELGGGHHADRAVEPPRGPLLAR